MDTLIDEAVVIARARNGDRDAFCELVRIHQGRLRAWASRFVIAHDEADDIVQDTFLTAWKHLDRFEEGRTVGPWLRGICKNAILEHLRYRRRHHGKHCLLVDEALAEVGSDQVESAEANPEPEITALRQCIDQLDPHHRDLLDQRFVQGSSLKQMAELLGKTVPAVSMILSRLKKTLDRCLQIRLGAARP